MNLSKFTHDILEAVILGEDSIVLRLQRNLLLNDSSSTALEFLQVITVGYRRYDTHIYCQQKLNIYTVVP